VTQVRRWLPVGVAALLTTLFAGGFGLAVDQLLTTRPQEVPQLRTVTPGGLDRLGITLAAPIQPPYCGVAHAVVRQGWLGSGSAGCAIARPAAEAAAMQGGTIRVMESLLAQVTSTRTSAIGHDHLAWLVVTQQTHNPCQQPASVSSLCIGVAGFAWNQLVVVDAYGGAIVTRLRLSPMGRQSPTLPRSGLPGALDR